MKTQPASTAAVRDRQAPLRQLYRAAPAEAWVTDRAETGGEQLCDPLHGRVQFGSRVTASVAYAVHASIGGSHDAPVPGDLLCAALASCHESSFRMVADVFGVRLDELRVRVEADVDVRGTLGMDADVPVAFQAMRVSVQLRAAPGTEPSRLRLLVQAGQRACVVLQTLRRGVPVSVEVDAGATDGATQPFHATP
jgi:uncharacterized OsmC-like protein